MITREVEIRGFRAVPFPWEVGRRILVCHKPDREPQSWQEVIFIPGPPTLDPRGMGPPDFAWGNPDEAAKTLHALAVSEDIEGGGWWAGEDREALRLSELLDAWTVPPSAKIDEGEDR